MSSTSMTIALPLGNTSISRRASSVIISILNGSRVSQFDLDLIIVPRYQNLLNLFFTVTFLVLYTIAVNTPNSKGNFDFVEGMLFAFVFGFFFDEVTKMLFSHEMVLTVDTKSASW